MPSTPRELQTASASEDTEPDVDEEYRRRQLERENLMRQLEAKQRERVEEEETVREPETAALLPQFLNRSAGPDLNSFSTMNEEEQRELIAAIYEQLQEYQRLGIPPIRDERADLLLPRVYFEFDKSEVRSQYQEQLIQSARSVLRELERRGDMILQIEGHADERGNEEYNLVLGHHRANAVRDLLKVYVTDPTTLQTVSFGEEYPAVPQSSERAWSENRRVMFTFLLRP